MANPVTLSGPDAPPKGIKPGHILFCAGTVEGTAEWSSATSALLLTVCPEAVVAKNDEYVLSFEVTNLGTDQDSPAVLIQANTLPIPVAPMGKDPGVLVGVAGGRSPLKIVVPVFITKIISQSSPLAGESNTLSVQLATNVDVTEIKVTIAGLLEATPCEHPVPIGVDRGGKDASEIVYFDLSRWTDAGGVFQFKMSDVPSETEHLLTLLVRNPTFAQVHHPQH